MSYILAFHPNNVITRNDKQPISLDYFREANPSVPLVDGQWFQLDDDRLIIMNEQGQGNYVDMVEHAALIDSIKNPQAAPVDKIYPIHIHPDAFLELDDMQHSSQTGEGVATGYTVQDGVQIWQYRNKSTEELIADSNNAAKTEILRLESEVTQRRFREAALGTDDGWLAAQDSLIAAERDKLQ